MSSYCELIRLLWCDMRVEFAVYTGVLTCTNSVPSRLHQLSERPTALVHPLLCPDEDGDL